VTAILRATLALALASSVAAAAAPEAALAHVTAAGLRADMRFLADDTLEGRRTGTRGFDVAAAWVAAQFEGLGLAPGGDGSFLQAVPLVEATSVVAESRLSLVFEKSTDVLRPGDDFVLSPDVVHPRTLADAPLVFAGYGVTTREHDDYASLDVKDRVVAVLTGAPASLSSSERAHNGSAAVKEANAASHGAAGVLYLVLNPEPRLWQAFVRRARSGTMRWMDADGVPSGTSGRLQVVAALAREPSLRLLKHASVDIDEAMRAAGTGPVTGYALPGRLRADGRTEVHRLSSANVVGVLRGADPTLSRESVVLSAHLDHLGVGTPHDGDAVYNGAIDNASGVAALVEIARALVATGHRPRRSIVFLAVTGEEQGLLGSDYFAAHVPAACGRVVADVTVDMLTVFYRAEDLVAFGAEHSSLGEVATRAGARLGLPLDPDPMPEERIFVRSDQYSFVKRGVPALLLMGGFKSTEPGIDKGRIFHEWLEHTYHSPADDMSQTMDMQTGVLLTRVALLIAADVADASAVPVWNAGDAFAPRP
jgi:hypothetical protein